MDIKYPHVQVQLLGEDGNVFAICGRCTAALRRAGIAKPEIDAFTSGLMGTASYDEALRYVMRHVETA